MLFFWKTFLLYSKQQDRKERGIMMERSLWLPFAKFCKNEFQLFLIANMPKKALYLDGKFHHNVHMMRKAKESAVSWWPIRDVHQLRIFAKINFDFFLSLKQGERKCSVLMAISRWPPFAKFCKNKFWLVFRPYARQKKARCHDGQFAMATIC